MLAMDPDRRPTGEQCLQHPYFDELRQHPDMIPGPIRTTSHISATAAPGKELEKVREIQLLHNH